MDDAVAVGLCIDDRHPSLPGRVLVQLHGDAAPGTWLPCVAHVVARTGDRVLVQQPRNWPEAIVIGVLDGYEPRAAAPPTTARVLELRRDEQLVVCDDRGEPLVALADGACGPTLRLARPDLALEVPGRLSMRAGTIRLESSAGAIEIEASGDVRIAGELVELN
jgi:hypothetical protein